MARVLFLLLTVVVVAVILVSSVEAGKERNRRCKGRRSEGKVVVDDGDRTCVCTNRRGYMECTDKTTEDHTEEPPTTEDTTEYPSKDDDLWA